MSLSEHSYEISVRQMRQEDFDPVRMPSGLDEKGLYPWRKSNVGWRGWRARCSSFAGPSNPLGMAGCFLQQSGASSFGHGASGWHPRTCWHGARICERRIFGVQFGVWVLILESRASDLLSNVIGHVVQDSGSLMSTGLLWVRMHEFGVLRLGFGAIDLGTLGVFFKAAELEGLVLFFSVLMHQFWTPE